MQANRDVMIFQVSTYVKEGCSIDLNKCVIPKTIIIAAIMSISIIVHTVSLREIFQK